MKAAVSTRAVDSTPGAPHHSAADAATMTRVQNTIQALRPLPWSAMAPRIGLRTAMAKAAAPWVNAHWEAPVVLSGAMAAAK